MPAKLLVIALDAAEAEILSAGAAEGRHPNLARLAATGTSGGLGNSMEFLPGTIWPELHTGRAGWRDGHYCHVGQLFSGETRTRDLRVDDIEPAHAWFNTAAAAGRRMLVVDPVQMVSDVGAHGVSVDQWRIHDRNWDEAVHPGDVAEVVARHSHPAPYVSCDDAHGCTVEGYDRLLDSLFATLAAKRDLTLELLEGSSWDGAFVTFTESHCVGHQFWHFRDPGSPFHDSDAPPHLRGAVEAVYAALDSAVGALWESAGDDATVAVIASHGMMWEVGGPAVIQVALERLGHGSAGPPLMGVRDRIPTPLRRLARRLSPRGVTDALGLDSREFERPGLRALALQNNRCAAVRLRVKGRDAGGVIDPGDLDAEVGALRRAFEELRTVEGDEPIVASMASPRDLYGDDAHPDLPDLLVDFRRDVGALDRVHSEATGLIEVPLRWDWLPRTGDHTDHTWAWFTGPGADRVRLDGASAVDVAPTLLDLLGVAPTDPLDGRSLLEPSTRRAPVG